MKGVNLKVGIHQKFYLLIRKRHTMKRGKPVKKVKRNRKEIELRYSVGYLKSRVLEFICIKEFDGWKVLITTNQIEKKSITYGETDHWAKTINLNSKILTFDKFISVILHEVLHVLFPNFSEEEIQKCERSIIKIINRKEAETILKATIRHSTFDR